MNRAGRWILFVAGLLLFAVALTLTVRNATPPDEPRVVDGYESWSGETLAVAESIPVQDGGRIKPLKTYAGFTMLRMYGARSVKVLAEEGGEEIRIKPLGWMLDIFFRPQLAVRTPSFRIDDSDVLRAVGVTPGEKRDRYSYEDLEPGYARLMELAQGYSEIEAKQRNPIEAQVVDLAQNLRSYEQLLGTFMVARNGVVMRPMDGVTTEPQRAGISQVMATAPVIREVLQRNQTEGATVPPHIDDLLQQVLDGARAAKLGLYLFPPPSSGDADWLSPGDRIWNVMSQQTRDIEGSIADIAAIEKVARSLPEGEAAFRSALVELKSGLVERAEARGEYRSVPLEADYYSKNWFLYALVWFLIGTVLAIAMWMTTGSRVSRWLGWGVWATTALGWVYVVIPIVKRCIIMQRPPVGNLYDTIIFICAAVVLLGAILELFMKRRLALGVLPIAGVILILLARMFEVGDGNDHMDPLVAVLRSNFWLTTHVICITLGYAGGLVCALISMVYVLLRGLRLDGGDASLRRSLTRTVYGMVCLTLFLSLVGTVLGGIWANDSWGRFWGWDPKENGALMIVLLYLAVLHGRLGGFLREWGIHLSCIFGAAVVTFSWWHVNLLGTGLHSYGFAEGGSVIWVLYGFVGLMLGFGFVARALEQHAARQDAAESRGQGAPTGGAMDSGRG